LFICPIEEDVIILRIASPKNVSPKDESLLKEQRQIIFGIMNNAQWDLDAEERP